MVYQQHGRRPTIESLRVDRPIKQATAAYLDLEQLIVTQELLPGTVVPERELIEKIGLGRTPVREAMQRLSWEGLIEVRPRSGIKIADIRLDDFAKVIDLRLVLEPRLASAATRFATDLHREQIAHCRATMQRSVATNDMKLYLHADKSFDAIMGDAAGNWYLTNILGPLQTHSRRFWYRFLARDGIEWPAARHMSIMSALVESDVDAAGEAMIALIQGMLDQATALAH